MITRLYAIRDIKAGSLVNVFPSLNDQSAIRSFYDLISDPASTVFSEHPYDFSLLYICSIKPNGDVCCSSDESLTLVDAKTLECGSSFDSKLLASDRMKKARYRDEVNKLREVETYASVRDRIYQYLDPELVDDLHNNRISIPELRGSHDE